MIDARIKHDKKTADVVVADLNKMDVFMHLPVLIEKGQDWQGRPMDRFTELWVSNIVRLAPGALISRRV